MTVAEFEKLTKDQQRDLLCRLVAIYLDSGLDFDDLVNDIKDYLDEAE